jgi:hypothetical protein
MLEQIKAEIKTSLLAGDRFRVDTLKMAQASLVNARIAKGSELDTGEEIVVVQKEIKKRYEAEQMYLGVSQEERAKKERDEAVMLEMFVPKLLAGEALKDAVERLYGESECADMNFGQLMQFMSAHLDNPDKAQLAQILKGLTTR